MAVKGSNKSFIEPSDHLGGLCCQTHINFLQNVAAM